MRSGRPAVSETSTMMFFEKERSALLADTLTAPVQSTQVAMASFSVMMKERACLCFRAFFWASSSWARLCDPFGMSKARRVLLRQKMRARMVFMVFGEGMIF